MSKEEAIFELRESLEHAYRLTPLTQIAVFILFELALIAGILYLNVGLPEAYIAGILITALLYPTIIKIRNFVSELIAFVLFGAALSAVACYLINKFVLTGAGLNVLNLWLVVVFLLILGIQMFHYTYEKARSVKTKPMIIVNSILTVIFAYAVWNILTAIIQAGLAIMILITALLSIAYFIAILPEKPF
ncbi:MAG: hypothetical protein NDP13_06080 [Crenarchaeota archaeon]|nr:hypothetical protein [Thermoproteota archaeon]MCR8454535.1 hypothetical protein [Thermoproteota archaeon]MCR8455009.1 hypothetical protein [Thermoproteota archaeon]MCR8470457.1 hypothetical protein [Thermoproteota archaeon]MCR8471474.1 hypothetical protein [Thermoproteota archaeon]